MTHPLIVIAALWLYVWGWRKHGFRKATFWACMIVMMIFPFAFTGLLLPSIFRLFGVHELSMSVRIMVGVGALAGAMIAARYVGWGKVLAGIFTGAMVVSAVVMMGFFFLMMGVLVHATVQGMVFIIVGTFILMGLSHGYRARGR